MVQETLRCGISTPPMSPWGQVRRQRRRARVFRFTPDCRHVDQRWISSVWAIALVWGDWCQGFLLWAISLFGRAATSPRPDLFFARLLRAAAVKGGRRAIAKRLALDGREHSSRLARPARTPVRLATETIPRGSSPIVRADCAPRTCIRPTREDRNHDAVMRIGGEAPRRRAHSKPRCKDHSPTSGCRHLGSSAAARHQ